MKTILWAAITANGAYMHGNQGYRWPKVVFEEFDRDASEAGNCILGRNTFTEYVDSGGSFGKLDVVLVSRTPREHPGVTCAGSPGEALLALEGKGHSTALVGGGDSLINAFLAEDLADELVLLVTPELGGGAGRVETPGGRYRPMELLETRALDAGTVRLHYSLR